MGSNGEIYFTVEDAITTLIEGHEGALTLTAVWDEDAPILLFPQWKQDGYVPNIDWYGDTDCTSRPITTAKDVLTKATTDNGVFKVYAKCTPIEFAIDFDFSGGTGSGHTALMNKSYDLKSTINLPQVSASKTYNDLVGWDVYVNGTFYGSWTKGTTVNGIIVNDANSVVVFKAKWKGITYKVTYNGNRPSGATYDVINIPATATWTYDANATLAAAPTLTGWKFEGWYRNTQCTTLAGQASETLSSPNYYQGTDVVLYAKWTQTESTIIFNANGGSTPTSSTTVKFDGTYGSLPTPTRSNYGFIGWFTSASGGTQVTSTSKVKGTTVTLFAQWILLKDSVDCSVDHTPEGTMKRDQKITDSDGKYDTLTFTNLDFAKLKSLGYTTVTLTITLDVSEIDDGYQDIWICKQGTNTRLLNKEFEHNSSKKDTSWGRYTFTFTLNVNEVFSSDGKMRIEYGANGKKDDDWKLGWTHYTIVFSK